MRMWGLQQPAVGALHQGWATRSPAEPSITSLGGWWRCVVGLWVHGKTRIQYSKKSPNLLDRIDRIQGTHRKGTRWRYAYQEVFFGWWRPPFLWLFGGSSRLSALFLSVERRPEIRSLRGRIVARTAACRDYDKLIHRDWDWNTHCQIKTMRHLLFRWYGITKFIPTWIVIWMLYVWYSQVGKSMAARLHHDITMPQMRTGCTLQPACLAAIAGRMWHC